MYTGTGNRKNELEGENTLNITITTFKPELIPQINQLLDAYKRMYPKVTAPPAESYLAPWTESGRNVFCAFDENGKLCGFAPVFLEERPDKPYTFWTAIRTHPELKQSGNLRDVLLEKIKERAFDIGKHLPLRKYRIAFQYNRAEQENIQHVISKGGVYIESAFLMKRDISQELPVLPLPEDIKIRYSKMTDETEQKAYLTVRNRVFVEGRPHQLGSSVISLEDWRILLHHIYQPNGTFITAFNNQTIIGGVTVYRNEDKNGEKTGITDDVFVVNEWRRRGIGRYLIREGLEYFKAEGLEVAQLEVNSANRRALNLYEQLGYVLTDESPFYVINLD